MENEETNSQQISVIMLVKDEIDYLKQNIPKIIPYTREILVMQDLSVPEEKRKEIHSVLRELCGEILVHYERELNNNFGEQRNAAQQRARYPWVFHIDPDEYIDEVFWKIFPTLLLDKRFDVFGIARRNFIDNQRTNHFEQDKNANPDLQFRLLKRSIPWIGKVHEHPEPVEYNSDRVCIVPLDIALNHYKDSERQKKQNEYYDQILKSNSPAEKKPIKKIIANSVYQTHEGITKHFREELKEFLRRGYQVHFTELYDSNWDPTGEIKQAYTPIDITGNDYIYYVNQPPIREQDPGRSIAGNIHHKNLICFLAFEGSKLPNQWAMVLKHPNIKQIWCPSTYNKDVYVACGIPKEKIKVIPHGIDPVIFNQNVQPLEILKETIKDKFVFLYVGTFHGTTTKDRKGLDLFIEAFRNAFGEREDVLLLAKINTIYAKMANPNFNLDDAMKGYFKKGKINIGIIDENLDDKQMASLYRTAQVYVSGTRAEGFNCPAIESMACGTPILVTAKSGHMDYCNENNATLIKADYFEDAENRFPYEAGCLWFKPDINDFTEKLLWIKEHYDEAVKKAEIAYKEIHEKWTWKDTVDRMTQAMDEL